VSRIFLFSHTNEFCGICVGDTEPVVACTGPKTGRRACEEGAAGAAGKPAIEGLQWLQATVGAVKPLCSVWL
jgi:hypothetical protein